jgi:hypothetical protein
MKYKYQVIAWDGCGNDNGNWGKIPDYLTIEESTDWVISYMRGGMMPQVGCRAIDEEGWIVDTVIPQETLERASQIREALKTIKVKPVNVTVYKGGLI